MRLQQVQPDEAIAVPGYEVQTLECVACREIERRHVFRGEGVPTISAVSSLPTAIATAAAPAPKWEASSAAQGEKEATPAEIPEGAPALEPVADIDEGSEMLRRAIEMVRNPMRGAPARGLIDARPASPAILAGSMRGRKPGRVVQIRHDPSCVAAYAAKDTRSGLVVLRHQDNVRLRAMCERLGWQVVEEGVAGEG
jgi:hypothetical protein